LTGITSGRGDFLIRVFPSWVLSSPVYPDKRPAGTVFPLLRRCFFFMGVTNGDGDHFLLRRGPLGQIERSGGGGSFL